ncbi:MAG: transposase [bacterium]|nr:MAG: transposase [bacterium]
MSGMDAALNHHLKELHLPTVRDLYESFSKKARQEGLSYKKFLLELCEKECEVRRQKRVERLLRQSRLPLEKNMESFELKRLPQKVVHQVKTLLEGSFLDKNENVLAFGNPGSGKTHLLCAISQELLRKKGKRAYFMKCSLLVQSLLMAKRDLKLEKLIKQLSKFDALIIDDIGYVQQDREEMEVLFTLLAERYERGSLLITSNLPFSKWEKIFKDPMTTAAAIDRLVHHSVIMELNAPSYRAEQAKKKKEPRKGGEK